MPQATLKRYVSAITSLDQREILPNIIDIENNYGICDVLNAFGRYKSSKMYKTESYVNEPLWKEGTSTGTVTGSGTPTVSFALTTASSPNRRKGDQVMFPDGKSGFVTNVVYAGNDATLTIQSVDGTNLTFVTGNKIKFFSNAVGERSDSRESLFYGATYYYQLLQIHRETHATSDVQMLSKVEAPKSGVWTTKEYAEKFMKVKTEVNAAMIASQISASQFSTATNSITDPVGGGIVQFQRGLRQYISAYGVNDDVTTPGTWTLTVDMSDLIDLLVAKKASGKYDMWGATAPLGKVDNHMKNLAGSGGITSARMNMDGKDVDFTIEKFKYKGFDFQKYLMPILNQPDIFGTTDYDNGLFYTPQGRVRTLDRDGNSSYEPRIQIRYKPQPKVVANKGNDVWAESHSGMYSEVNPSGTVAEAKVDWLTAQAIEILGAQHFAFQGRVAR